MHTREIHQDPKSNEEWYRLILIGWGYVYILKTQILEASMIM